MYSYENAVRALTEVERGSASEVEELSTLASRLIDTIGWHESGSQQAGIAKAADLIVGYKQQIESDGDTIQELRIEVAELAGERDDLLDSMSELKEVLNRTMARLRAADRIVSLIQDIVQFKT